MENDNRKIQETIMKSNIFWKTFKSDKINNLYVRNKLSFVSLCSQNTVREEERN